MTSYEQFYLEQILPISKQIEELSAEKARRYAALHARHLKDLEQLQEQKNELRIRCAETNKELNRQIFDLQGDLSPEAAARRQELTEQQHRNRLELTRHLDLCEVSIITVCGEYRNAKVRLCEEMHEKQRRLYELHGARNRDFRRRRHVESRDGRQDWSRLKRWIYRRFFAEKGGEA
jgi:hypothetical protein